jgi:uncharacterized protein with GYD domain
VYGSNHLIIKKKKIGGVVMATYVILTKLTHEGRKTVMKNPGRIWEVNREMESMGAKIIAQYATLGPYDYVNIIEAANNNVILRITSEMGARGTVEPMTMAATSIEDLIKEQQTANGITKE